MTVPRANPLLIAAFILISPSFALAEAEVPGFAARSQTDHDDSYVYRLPYADAVSYAVLQGYGSRLSHTGSEHFTIDFSMPEGTVVYSAREGEVVGIEDRFALSCWQDHCEGYANFVEILHQDGTLGRYFHLQQGSVIVELGQTVGRGEPIAQSGDTGYSSVPHLHFGVYRKGSDGRAQSIAVRFSVRGGFVGSLRAGGRYTNRDE